MNLVQYGNFFLFYAFVNKKETNTNILVLQVFPQGSLIFLSQPHPPHHTHSSAASILTSVSNLLQMSSPAHIEIVVSELLYPSQVFQLLDDRMLNLYVCGHLRFPHTKVTWVGQTVIFTSTATYFVAHLMYRYPITIYIDLMPPLPLIQVER